MPYLGMTQREPLGFTHRFFWSGEGLNYFSEIKEIKRPSAKRLRASRVFSRRWVRSFGLLPRQIAPRRVFIFRARCAGWGRSKVWHPQVGTAWVARANFRKIPKTFFERHVQAFDRDHAAPKLPRASRVLPLTESTPGATAQGTASRPDKKIRLTCEYVNTHVNTSTC
jgi:hypothetical protein